MVLTIQVSHNFGKPLIDLSYPLGYPRVVPPPGPPKCHIFLKALYVSHLLGYLWQSPGTCENYGIVQYLIILEWCRM